MASWALWLACLALLVARALIAAAESALYGTSDMACILYTLGRLRPSDKAYVRVWRAEPAYEVAGEELPDPPPSLALILGSTQSLSQNRNSKITELVIDAGETMVTGSRTVQVEVKE